MRVYTYDGEEIETDATMLAELYDEIGDEIDEEMTVEELSDLAQRCGEETPW